MLFISPVRCSECAAADNFTYAEIERAAKYAHDRGVKVYVTVNTMPHVLEYPALADYLKELGKTGIDALIVAGFGCCGACKRACSECSDAYFDSGRLR